MSVEPGGTLRESHAPIVASMRLKLNAAFLLTGISTTILGPMMPLLESRWGVGDAEAGLLFSAQFMANVCAAALVTPLARRFGYQRLIAAGLLLTAAGMAGFAGAPYAAALACACVYGFGLGLAIPSGNMAVCSSPRDVLWINWSWCAGAMSVPALTAWLGMTTWWVAAAAFACASMAFWWEPRRTQTASGAPSHWTLSKVARSSAVLLFIYVAIESSTGGWVASLVKRIPEASGIWAVATTIFWAAVLAGRALTNWALRRWSIASIITVGLLVGAAGIAGLLVVQTAFLTIGAGALCGFGLAPIYPMLVAEYAEREKKGVSLSGLVFAMGGIGGAVGPLATGFISQETGSLRLGLASALPAIGMMLWIRRDLSPSPLYNSKG